MVAKAVEEKQVTRRVVGKPFSTFDEEGKRVRVPVGETIEISERAAEAMSSGLKPVMVEEAEAARAQRLAKFEKNEAEFAKAEAERLAKVEAEEVAAEKAEKAAAEKKAAEKTEKTEKTEDAQ